MMHFSCYYPKKRHKQVKTYGENRPRRPSCLSAHSQMSGSRDPSVCIRASESAVTKAQALHPHHKSLKLAQDFPLN